jgi:ATP-binding cassette subfamily B protein
MTNLLKAYLKPYVRRLVLVVILVLAQSIGNLYLPSLNADIINNGVVKGVADGPIMTPS